MENHTTPTQAPPVNTSKPVYLEPNQPRNCRYLLVSYEFLEDVIRLRSYTSSPGFLVTQTGFPEDGRIISLRPGFHDREFLCIVSSASFQDVEFGEPLRPLYVTFTRRELNAKHV